LLTKLLHVAVTFLVHLHQTYNVSLDRIQESTHINERAILVHGLSLVKSVNNNDFPPIQGDLYFSLKALYPIRGQSLHLKKTKPHKDDHLHSVEEIKSLAFVSFVNEPTE